MMHPDAVSEEVELRAEALGVDPAVDKNQAGFVFLHLFRNSIEDRGLLRRDVK